MRVAKSDGGVESNGNGGGAESGEEREEVEKEQRKKRGNGRKNEGRKILITRDRIHFRGKNTRCI